MAKIWFLKEGEIQHGPPIAGKSIDWCEANLGLRSDNWWVGLEARDLTIGQKSELGPYRNFRYVVIEVVDEDLRGKNKVEWKSGYYVLDMDAQQARRILEEDKDGTVR